jgi:uncharacterized membrane protein
MSRAPAAPTIDLVTTTTHTTTRPARRKRRDWPIITGLFLLALVPSVAGAARFAELTSGPERTADNARYVDMPLPVLLHIPSVTLFALLGALQLAPRFRARNRRWHRICGRVVFAAGLVAAGSGMWMTAFSDLPVGDSAPTNAARFVVGTVMIVGLLLGLRAAMRRDLHTHRAWMLRAYALGMGAGTQVLTTGPLLLVMDTTAPHYTAWRTVGMIGAWVINAAFAEHLIRRHGARRSGGADRDAGRPVNLRAARLRTP